MTVLATSKNKNITKFLTLTLGINALHKTGINLISDLCHSDTIPTV